MWEWHETSQRLFVGGWYRVDCNHPPEAKKFLYVFTVGQGGCGRQRYGSIQWTAVKVPLPAGPDAGGFLLIGWRSRYGRIPCRVCNLRIKLHPLWKDLGINLVSVFVEPGHPALPRCVQIKGGQYACASGSSWLSSHWTTWQRCSRLGFCVLRLHDVFNSCVGRLCPYIAWRVSDKLLEALFCFLFLHLFGMSVLCYGEAQKCSWPKTRLFSFVYLSSTSPYASVFSGAMFRHWLQEAGGRLPYVWGRFTLLMVTMGREAPWVFCKTGASGVVSAILELAGFGAQ